MKRELAAPLMALAMLAAPEEGERGPRGSNPSRTAGPKKRKEWTGKHEKEKARRRRQARRRKGLDP